MKRRCHKFKNFLHGLIFASFSCIAIILCISNLLANPLLNVNILLTFLLAIFNLILGFITLYRNNFKFYKKV